MGTLAQLLVVILDADVGSAFFSLNAGSTIHGDYLVHLIRRLLFPLVPVGLCIGLAVVGHVNPICMSGMGTATIWYFVNMAIVAYPFCLLRPGKGTRSFSWELMWVLGSTSMGIALIESVLNLFFQEYFAWAVGFSLYTVFGLLGLPALFFDPRLDNPYPSSSSYRMVPPQTPSPVQHPHRNPALGWGPLSHVDAFHPNNQDASSELLRNGGEAFRSRPGAKPPKPGPAGGVTHRISKGSCEDVERPLMGAFDHDPQTTTDFVGQTTSIASNAILNAVRASVRVVMESKTAPMVRPSSGNAQHNVEEDAAPENDKKHRASAFVGYMTFCSVAVSLLAVWLEYFQLVVSGGDNHTRNSNSLKSDSLSPWRYSLSLYLLLPVQALVVFSDRKQDLKFNFSYLLFYSVVGARVPDYLGSASIEIFLLLGQEADEYIVNHPNQTGSFALTRDIRRYFVSMGYVLSMAVYMKVLKMVTHYMTAANIYPRFLFHAQLYYYFFWYILIISVHKVDGLFWAMLISMNVHYILSNTGVYDDVMLLMRREYSQFYSWSSRAMAKLWKNANRNIHRFVEDNISQAPLGGRRVRRKRRPTALVDATITSRIDTNKTGSPNLFSAQHRQHHVAFFHLDSPTSSSPIHHQTSKNGPSIPETHHEEDNLEAGATNANTDADIPRSIKNPLSPDAYGQDAHNDDVDDDGWSCSEDSNMTDKQAASELLPLIYRIKLADQDSLADITSLFMVPSLMTVFSVFAMQQVPVLTNEPQVPGQAPPRGGTEPTLYFGGAQLDLVNLWLRFGLMFVARMLSSRVSRAVFSYKIQFYRLALFKQVERLSLLSDEVHQRAWQRAMLRRQPPHEVDHPPFNDVSQGEDEGAPPSPRNFATPVASGAAASPPLPSAMRYNRDRLLSSKTRNRKSISGLHATIVKEFQTCYWYFVLISISCAYSCFQHHDLPTRFTFCD